MSVSNLVPASIKNAVRSKARQFLGIEEVANQTIHTGMIIGLGNREVVLPDGRTARAFGLQLKTMDGNQTFFGSDLFRAVTESGLTIGDMVEVDRLGTHQVSRPDGRLVTQTLWDVRKLTQDVQVIESKCKPVDLSVLGQTYWQDAHSIYNLTTSTPTPAEEWLRNLKLLPDFIQSIDKNCIRFDERLPDAETGKLQPTAIFPVLNSDSKLVTSYFVHLDKWGVVQNAEVFDIQDEKALKGSSIRIGELDPNDRTLCIAECVDDALVINAATGWPCWTSHSIERLAEIAIPESINMVFVFSNKYRGKQSDRCFALSRRLKTEGKCAAVVTINKQITSGEETLSWSQLFHSYGAEAFPIRKA